MSGLEKTTPCVFRTRGYATKEEAIEVWNTWAGGRHVVSREDFNRLNNAVKRDYPIENGKVVLPDGEDAFGNLNIVEEANYEYPWPKIYFADYENSERGLYGDDDMFLVYKLRARWRLVGKDHVKLKQRLCVLIRQNDRDNATINAQLREWNCILEHSGFPPFEENDLRGVDLSGLTIAKEDGERVWLRGVDLSYSECHLLLLVNANLYGANCLGMKATGLDLSQATAHGVSFKASLLHQGRFVGTDLGSAEFTYAMAANCTFDGANCHGSDFSFANLRKASFDNCSSTRSGKQVYSDVSDVTWNDDTLFSEVVFNGFLSEQNAALAAYIHEQRHPKSPREELASSVEMKPGAFGFSIDLSRVFGALKIACKKGTKTIPQHSSDEGKERSD